MLDHHVQLDPEAGSVSLDGHPVAAQHAAHARAGGQADDAVTREGRLGDDLGDDVARDREAPVLELQRQVVRHRTD